ncbi:hypothetical protein N431DRAFT_473228 [Stipitochalara longipes BDJ]|nr:hypothetical protein N431DRAFT_473228 [Stipitochalara longipes BDJ]
MSTNATFCLSSELATHAFYMQTSRQIQSNQHGSAVNGVRNVSTSMWSSSVRGGESTTAGFVNVDPYSPFKDGYDYVDKPVSGSRPWWDRVQETLHAADNRAKYSQNYQSAHRDLFPERDRLDAEYKCGYVNGVTDTVRQEEPGRRPDGFIDGWRYDQPQAERRNAWVQRAIRDVDDH